MKKYILLILAFLLCFSFVESGIVYAYDIQETDENYEISDLESSNEPEQPKDQFWDQPSHNEPEVENDSDSNSPSPWLFIGIGVGVAVLAVDTVLIVKKVKCRNEW